MAIIRTSFDTTTNTNLLKVGTLRKLFDTTQRKTQTFYSGMCNDKTTSLEKETDLRMAGIDTASEIAEGQNIPIRAPVLGTEKTYTQRQFGTGFRMTHKMDYFNKYKLWSRWAKSLGRVMAEAKDVEVHVMFNSPTSSSLTCGVGFDTYAIGYATHTGLNPNNTDDNYSNYGNEALSHTALETGRTYFATLVDDMGMFMGGSANKLIYAPALHFTAVELTGSALRPHEISNTTNKPVKQMGLSLFENPRLSSSTAWFLADTANDDYDYNVFTAMKPKMFSKDAPDNTQDKIITSLQYFTYGWGDPRLLYVGKT